MKQILIIGGGPGGYVAAIRAAQLGAAVTLVEQAELGGTCLNVGCIPTKALLHSAELYSAAKNGASVGVIADPKLDFGQVQANKQNVTTKLVRGVAGLIKANKITFIKGTASFENAATVKVHTEAGEQSIKPDATIIATGSLPAMPPIPGLDGPRCIDSTGALALREVPKSMVIIGGGVVGTELATAYRAFGAQVTIIEMLPEILPMFDADIVKQIRRKLVREKLQIVTSAKVLEVEHTQELARVHVETETGKQVFEADKVLVSIGRRANTGALRLEAADIANDRGNIIVNAHMQTNVPGIYAIGDCLGGTMLAHVASAQGEVAAEHALGHAAKYDESTSPSCVYTNPEMAMVGLTEAQAQEKGLRYVVGKFPLSANGKALIENGGYGMVKIIAGATYNEILGVGIVGPRATDLIAEAALAIRLEATADELISTIHAHPTIGEAMHEAALAVQNRAIHVINGV
ncbi:dihydrolipoyl dehydrogenase [Eubacteriales bacterium OttesenSCG-928-K08]|nr:dihydrolipoyl dehydrogenase [Eubacteriales bacterium OttesenSCG-928-K08]